MRSPCDLAGLGVLVTRPAAQAEHLCGLILGANGRPLPFPTVEIRPGPDPRGARTLLTRDWDLVIFVSTNAVDRALALGADGHWPGARHLAAVGRATALALEAAGRAPDLVPTGRYDSESLLAMPALARMADQRVLIVRGQDGRALLGDELSRRGAVVHYAEVYRRVIPDAPGAPLLQRWHRDVQVVTATSDEILRNLIALLGDAGLPLLLRTPLVVISTRSAETARDLGFEQVLVAERAEDSAILRAICILAGPGPSANDLHRSDQG